MSKTDVINPVRCPECGSSALAADPARGEVACTACGLVVEERALDVWFDKRFFNSEEERARMHTGPAYLYAPGGWGLMTYVGTRRGWGLRDAHGRRLPPSRQYEFRRLRWLNETVRAQNCERSLDLANLLCRQYASALQLSWGVVDGALEVAFNAVREGFTLGRGVEPVAAAAVYIAARQCRCPVTYAALERVSGVPVKRITAAAHKIALRWRLRVPHVRAAECLEAIASELSLPPAPVALAREMLERLGRREQGKHAHGLAAGALYAACLRLGAPRTQRELAAAAKVTPVTVRNAVRLLQRASARARARA